MPKSKILITGGTGLLGTHLLLSKPNNYQVFATIHDYQKVLNIKGVEYVSLDVKIEDQVTKLIDKIQPQVVIHTAAHSSVDYCEKNQKEAKQTNILSTKFITQALKPINGKIIFCSTNMTYDGLNPPYNEKSEQHPQTFYGKTKVESERIIASSEVNYTIIRLMTMYGWNWQPMRKNMISMAYEKLSNNEKLWMTNDVYNNLLFVEQAAEFFWQMVKNPKTSDKQLFNIAGADCVNRYQATMMLCDVFDFDKSLVKEVESSFFKGQETPRSPNTCFDTHKARSQAFFNPLKLKKGLSKMKESPIPTNL